ncbi:MAG: C39 family peptidase, partial [Deltaproteobacteria bacterium]|nr:C39 family peptidase [Deltaproteobacteria bacterium]
SSPPSLLLQVPFIEQKDNLCGPAAVAMVLSFYGLPVSQQKVAEKTFTASLNATLLPDLVNYVNELPGFAAWSASLSLEELAKKIQEGYPTIVLVDEGIGPYQVLHYMVVVGIDQSQDKIVCHTRKDINKVFRIGYFLKKWRKMDNLALTISPEETQVR